MTGRGQYLSLFDRLDESLNACEEGFSFFFFNDFVDPRIYIFFSLSVP